MRQRRLPSAIVVSRGTAPACAPANNRPHFKIPEAIHLSPVLRFVNEKPRWNFYDFTISEKCVQNMGKSLNNHKFK